MRHWIPIVLFGFVSFIKEINSLDETGTLQHLRVRQSKTEDVGEINRRDEDELERAWNLAFGSSSNNITPFKTTLSGQKKAKRNDKNKNGASCPKCSRNKDKQNGNANKKNKPTKKTPSKTLQRPTTRPTKRPTTRPTKRPTKKPDNSANKSKQVTKPTKLANKKKPKNTQGRQGNGQGGRPKANSIGAGKKGVNGQGGSKPRSSQTKSLNKTNRAGAGRGESVKDSPNRKNLRAGSVEGGNGGKSQSSNKP
eukprot:CCRYP_017655-RA/>CCRYP_017655-RA protein AED:0.33 eAED:0.33 QI:236/1/1/1/1/1/2/1788/251